MIFVGGGGLLSAAVDEAFSAGLSIDAVFCPIGDSSLSKNRKKGVVCRETNDLNNDLRSYLEGLTDQIILSINNRIILSDALLSCDAEVFNIHNGLVQGYRGIGEVCVFAALCNGEKKYGVTLHRMLPGQKVDSGPVLDQLEFVLKQSEDFSEVMTKSLDACHRIFQANIARIANKGYDAAHVNVAELSYSYRDIPRICANARADDLARASNLGIYRELLPQMAKLVEKCASTLSIRGGSGNLNRVDK